MPVKPGFLYHQVVTPSFKISPPGLDQHDDIYNHAREYMKSMKTGDRKKVIREIRRGLCIVNIQKRISSPPGAFMIQMRPFPCLTTQEGQATKNCEKHPFYHCLPVVNLSCTHRHNHGN